MIKLNIRTSESDLTLDMIDFAKECYGSFVGSIEKNEYGVGWSQCIYSNMNFEALAVLNKSGSVSVCVNRVNKK